MNQVEKTLLVLIRKSQFNSIDLSELGNVDMDLLYLESTYHSLLGLISNELPSDYLDSKWKEAKLRQKALYIRYCNAEDELRNVLDSASIPFVILKGNAAAIGYAIPSCRTMGDIDFIVPYERFDETVTLLVNHGFNKSKDNGRHINFRKNAFPFELHRYYSHADVNIEDYIVEGISNREFACIEDHSFPMLPKLANGLVLLDHMRTHLKEALGLRQVIDWMMFVYRNLDDDFWNEHFRDIAIEKGMYTLAVTATRACQIYLGLSESITWCKDADKHLCEQFIECILKSGNFGRKNGDGNQIENVRSGIRRVGFFHWMQSRGEANWRAYHKYHWLKPFCWIYQMFRYLIQGLKTKRNHKDIKVDLDRSKERYDLLKKLEIV